MQFGLFPSNLNAVQIFFCRSDVLDMHPVEVEVAPGRVEEQMLQALPHQVLRSDPSIECYNGDHWLALALSLFVIAVYAVAVPVLLFKKIKGGLRAQVNEARPRA